MNDLSIKIEDLYKEYSLGIFGSGTLKGELQSMFARWRHKEDPNLKIGARVYDKNERFMALKGITFSIKKGERIGILGHNGAGKSTLLKLICRVTAPTKGRIYINGRITSMLEVGTGFHPELTGRENVYLNGAILGMSKEEIDEIFDTIVDFSEVGQFIDTPIKRYSSGMKVKLGFSVASHLKSEIMIMDEVLAVGDVRFQNKCISRMKKAVDDEGKTVLYVSHNMATVKLMCNRCLVLDQGRLVYDGNTEEAISLYMNDKPLEDDIRYDVVTKARNQKCVLVNKVTSLEILGVKNNIFPYGAPIHFRLSWQSKDGEKKLKAKAIIRSVDNTSIGVALMGELKNKTGENKCNFTIDTSYFYPGHYLADIVLYEEDELGGISRYDDRVTVIKFSIVHSETSIHLKHWFSEFGYAVLPCIKKEDSLFQK